MHEDATDEISLKSRTPSFAAGGQRSRNPTLKVCDVAEGLLDGSDHSSQFDDHDIVHQYDRKGQEDAIHTARTHRSDGEIEYGPSHRTASDTHQPYVKSPTEEKSHTFFGARPFKSFRRRFSGNDEEDDLSTVPLTPAMPQGILDTHHAPSERTPVTARMDSAVSRTSFNTLLNKFAASDGPDLRLGPTSRRGSKESPATDDMVRGGAHRGTKDYPHLKKSAAEQEQEERRGLVVSVDDDASDSDSEGDRGSAAGSGTEGEGGTVRRLPNIPTASQGYSGYPPRS